MADDEYFHKACPNCGRNEIKADGRYGNKLKGRELFRQILRNPIWWVGFALLVLPAWFLGPDRIAWRYGLEALGFVLMVISGERIRRTVFAPSAATRFPEARYTCRGCGHQWTSEESQIATAYSANEREPALVSSRQVENTQKPAGQTPASGSPDDTQAPPPDTARETAKKTINTLGLLALLAGFALVSCFGGMLLLGFVTRFGDTGGTGAAVMLICGVVIPLVLAGIVFTRRFRSS